MCGCQPIVIYCEGRQPNSLVLPSDTRLLYWYKEFLDYHLLQGQKNLGKDSLPSLFIITTVHPNNPSNSEDAAGVSCISHSDMEKECKRVELPCSISNGVVRSGLATLLRFMTLTCHSYLPEYGFNHLLGYKETCFNACVEVSQWTQFAMECLLPTLAVVSSLIDAFAQPSSQRLQINTISNTLNMVERRFDVKPKVATYNRKYFKVTQSQSLKSYYSRLHETSRLSETSADVRFLTGHLPNLIDLLTYVLVEDINALIGSEYLAEFPSSCRWYNNMRQLPGINYPTCQLKSSVQMVAAPPSDAHTKLSSVLNQLSLDEDADTSLLHPKSTLISATVDSNSTALTTDDANNTTIPAHNSCLRDTDIVDELSVYHTYDIKDTSAVKIDWESLPYQLDPGRGGKLPGKRSARKRQQLESMYTHALSCINSSMQACDDTLVVEFCAGGGHLGLLLAYLHPSISVHLIENKEESLDNAHQNMLTLGLTNITLYQCNLTKYKGAFNIGVTLHACGLAADLVIEQCIRSRASLVVCPCCYGTDMKRLRHSSDKTEHGIEQQSLGQLCMKLSDIDRKLYIDSQMEVTSTEIYFMEPKTCSPKNHILVCAV
ncbi:Gstcd [Bugula neritina]|uniref:Gstcd n=1 Tax=Bugula neritina TaxID=10212 RepID=A0A7J7JK05_BUGNE|nr:Gstcd [Bugula neritina]